MLTKLKSASKITIIVMVVIFLAIINTLRVVVTPMIKGKPINIAMSIFQVLFMCIMIICLYAIVNTVTGKYKNKNNENLDEPNEAI